MDSSPDHPGCPKQRSETQKLMEPASRMRLQIPPRRNPHQPRTGPGTREYVDDFRENLATLKENYNRQGQTFDGENITICITVFNLVYRLESLKEHEQDMRPRLVERLEKRSSQRQPDTGTLLRTEATTQTKKQSMLGNAWRVLDMEENLQEGLDLGKARKQYGRKAKKDNGAGGCEAMNIDG
ncbi:hypothetical protein HBI21_019040 [Parastagonospora nodorum]|nr:hypothetical protein HBI21_019040 [Parastagonospora nodorum]